MVERLLPSDDPIAEEVLEWTIKRDSKDITQLMKWMETAEIRRDRQVLLNRAMDLICLLYTSPSPRDATLSRMPSSA